METGTYPVDYREIILENAAEYLQDAREILSNEDATLENVRNIGALLHSVGCELAKLAVRLPDDKVVDAVGQLVAEAHIAAFETAQRMAKVVQGNETRH
ncbi:hypothetical protein ACFQ3P_13780 [Paraburkholderia sabiae]|uniref:Uncharacterized protein n=1 Tax=Paraburkholderia sabiae TaxID=273251 RepID=A0ABU9QD49_9BURK|nr:hypothetical protein [Paraburkholderia sabiae]WJZ76169.1 hypothetical protein QEN71_10320 [Paraburkholderia sabiae]CAD6525978.1 hypothetical protein LMG24235_01905 [Paraburkholderia sabiae]